jgi:hypothetical protein
MSRRNGSIWTSTYYIQLFAHFHIGLHHNPKLSDGRETMNEAKWGRSIAAKDDGQIKKGQKFPRGSEHTF